MKTKVLYGCILLFCCLSGLRAQDTEFWFVSADLDNATHVSYPTFFALSNDTQQEAHIEITLYNGGATLKYNATIAPGELYRHNFVNAADVEKVENPAEFAGAVTQYGVCITSDVKVTAYYMMNALHSKDIFTLKGRQALGREFYVPMQSDNAASSLSPMNYGGYDQIDMVATENNTTVTIVPAGNVRLATESVQLSAAGAPIVRTLHKGQTLKILEYAQDELPTLAGTRISSNNPIAVTVTEDLVWGDTSGDQIVPVDNLATRYIVPRGYRTNSPPERFYLVGAAPGATGVKIYSSTSSSAYTTETLNQGEVKRVDFPAGSNAANAVYVEADRPVYVYQRTGYGEEGAALLPSVYAIRQTQLSFYQPHIGYQVSSTKVNKGFIIFRTGTQGGFTIRYGADAFIPLTLTPLDIPNVPQWKIARFDFNYNDNLADGRVITVQSSQSAFSLGYIMGHNINNDSYGYFSAFGAFEFPAITYLCGSSVTLQGGYALSYEWRFNGAVISTESSIVATQEGEYTLKMTQDPDVVIATTLVQRVSGGLICPDTVICTGTAPSALSVSGASGDRFQWQISSDNIAWDDVAGATSPTYTPGPLTQPTWYKRKTGASQCAMEEESGSVKIGISPCVLPVNPHLMIRYKD
jgi:hypothetical protein